MNREKLKELWDRHNYGAQGGFDVDGFFDSVIKESDPWTLVEDDLPEHWDEVIMAFGEPFFGKCTVERDMGYYRESDDDDEEGYWCFSSDERRVVGWGVVAWMPLPKVDHLEDMIRDEFEEKNRVTK